MNTWKKWRVEAREIMMMNKAITDPQVQSHKYFCRVCGTKATQSFCGPLQYIDCPGCDEIRKKEEAKSEEIRKMVVQERLTASAGFPAIFQDDPGKGHFVNLKTFNVSRIMPESAQDGVREIVERIRGLAAYDGESGRRHFPPGIILTGPYGVGKTHLAISIMKIAIWFLIPAMYSRAPDLCDYAKSQWKRADKTNSLEKFGRHGVVPVLVIDEMELAKSKKDIEVLDQLVDRRWSEGLCTVLATNQTSGELLKQIGVAAWDRIAASKMLLQFPPECVSFRTGQNYAKEGKYFESI